MTPQQVYNKAKRHLLKQGSRCLKGGRCVFRYRGKACAVGALLTDAEAKRLLELGANGYDASTLHDRKMLPKRLTPHVRLLGELQCVHDHELPRRWPLALAELAKTVGLKP